jgi:hypothetical protein
VVHKLEQNQDGNVPHIVPSSSLVVSVDVHRDECIHILLCSLQGSNIVDTVNAATNDGGRQS